MIFDCPSTSTRDRKTPHGRTPGVALNESMLVEVGEAGMQPAIVKHKMTKPGPYRTGRPAMEASKEATPFVLVNPEASDAGSENFAWALAETLKAIHDATGAMVAPYMHFHWHRDDALERWHTCEAAFVEAGAWPSHLVISGHWLDATSVDELIDRIVEERSRIRRLLPHYPLAVLVCPHITQPDLSVKLISEDEMNELMKRIGALGMDVIFWYEPSKFPAMKTKNTTKAGK